MSVDKLAKEVGVEVVVKALQYLYYVKCTPAVSDYDFDLFCKRNGIFGGGGSDRAQDYMEAEVVVADRLLRGPHA